MGKKVKIEFLQVFLFLRIEHGTVRGFIKGACHAQKRQMAATTRRCHYDVLGVERSATDDDIKKAYRKVWLG